MTDFDQRYQNVGMQFNAESINITQQYSSYQVDTAFVALAQQKFMELPLDSIPEIAALPQGSRMPFSPNPLFVGRQDDLQAIATVLKENETVLISSVNSTAVTGMGGMGKTQLASEFVHRYGQYFWGGIFWLSFADANAVPTEIAGCSSMRDLMAYPGFNDFSLDKKIQLVGLAWQSPLPRLLIFDNCEDEALFNHWRPHTGGCKILITSLRPNWSSELDVKVLPLGILNRNESVKLLRTGCTDLTPNDPYLNAIAQELGDLPLALYLASMFLKRYRYSSLGRPENYLEKLRENMPLNHPSLQEIGIIHSTNHIRHVERTFAIALETLDEDDQIDFQAIRLLKSAACFVPYVPIPREILRGTLVQINAPDPELIFEKALERLLELGVLEEVVNGSLRIHRLISDYVKKNIETNELGTKAVVEKVIHDVAFIYDLAGSINQILALQPHLRAITDQAKQRHDIFASKLCNVQGAFFMKVGAYNEAKKYLDEALNIMEQSSEDDLEGRVVLHNNIAEWYGIEGHYEQAEEFAHKALDLSERKLGRDHILRTDSLNILAKLAIQRGKFDEAEKFVREVLIIRERILESNHYDLAITFQLLATCLKGQDKFEEAKKYCNKALAIFRQILGENHPRVASCLKDLADIYYSSKKYTEAEEYYKKAKNILEGDLGENHPEVAYILSGLAICYYKQGKFILAEPLYERAKDILLQSLDTIHPNIDRLIQNLLENYVAQDKNAQAEPLFYLLLDNRERIYGPDNLNVAVCLKNLGDFYDKQGKFTEAELLFKRAINIYNNNGEYNHSDVNIMKSKLRKYKQK